MVFVIKAGVTVPDTVKDARKKLVKEDLIIRAVLNEVDMGENIKRELHFPFIKHNPWQKKFIEKRGFMRLEEHHLLKYKIMVKGQKLSYARNISASGVLFFSNEPFAMGDVVDMEIIFPSYKEPIRARARVIRIKELQERNGFEVGSEFTEISEKAKNFIDQSIITIYKDEVGDRLHNFWDIILKFFSRKG